MSNDSKKMVGIIGFILMIIGCFLPFAKVTYIISINANYIDGDGAIILIISALCLIFFLANLKGLAAVGCLISLGIVGYDVYKLYDLITTSEYGSLASIGIGPILIIIGGIIAIYGCVDGKKNQPTLASDNNTQNIKFCSNCGKSLNINDEFCSSCGTKQG